MDALDPQFLFACAGIGALGGLLGGMLGIGGGVVIVPALLALFEVFGLPAAQAAPIAVATSLTTIIATSAAAARAQWLRGSIDVELFRRWAPALVAGSLVSGPVAGQLPAGAFQAFIGCFLLAVGIIMSSAWQPSPHRALPRGATGIALGGSAGLVSGMAGIGGGNVIVPTLVYFNVPIRLATGTSSAMGLPIALAGTISFLVAGWDRTNLAAGTLGFVHLPAALAIATLSFFAAPIGVAVAHRIPAAQLKRAFGFLLLLVSMRMLSATVGLLSA